MKRFGWWVGLVVGALLVAAAGVVRWSVAPAVTVLPGNTDTTRVYAGTAAAVFNPTAVPGPMLGAAVLRGVPVQLIHRVRVTATRGDAARMADTQVVTMPGRPFAALAYTYAVDRRTLGAATGFAGVVRQTGLTFNFPLRTNRHDYTGWVFDTGRTTRVAYAGTARRDGLRTYTFTATVPPTRITDPQLLRLLPRSMSKATLMTIVPALGWSTAKLTQMNTLLQRLPDPVPFAYTYQLTSTYEVAPTSGVIVDVQRHEVRSAWMVDGSRLVSVGPVMDLTYAATPATVRAAVNDARTSAGLIRLVHTTLPLALLLAGGLVALSAAAGLVARRRRTPPGTPAGPAAGGAEDAHPASSGRADKVAATRS